MPEEKTPEEIAAFALEALGDAFDERVAGVVRRLRREARQHAVACLLADSQYAVAAEMARRVGWPEDLIFDGVSECAFLLGDDEYLAFEDAFGHDNSLLDALSDTEARDAYSEPRRCSLRASRGAGRGSRPQRIRL